MKFNDFFLNICMRDIENEGSLTIWTYSVQKCCLENLQNIHFLLKLVWRLILTSEVIKMRSEDILTRICSTDRPTEDILSICTTLDQKWGHQVLGIMLWGMEADFDLGGHQKEVGGLFLQNMFERHTNWRYPISLCHFEPKMRSPGVRDYAMRRSNRSFWQIQTHRFHNFDQNCGGGVD